MVVPVPILARAGGFAACFAVALVSTGCDEPVAGEGFALKAALAAAEARALETRVTVQGLSTAEGWLDALRRSFARHASRLGGRAYTLTTTYSLETSGAPPMETTERRLAVVTLNGDAHLDHHIAWRTPDDQGEGGRRCWRIAGRLHHARHTGPASTFEERGGEGDRCLDAAIEPLQSLLRALTPQMRVAARAGEPMDGRETITVALAPESDPAAAPTALPAFWQPASPQASREADQETMGVPGPRGPLFLSHGVLRRLEGTSTLDAETGLPLAARFEARFEVQKGGLGGTLVVRVECMSTPHRGAVPPPDAVVPVGPRPRPFLERAHLLGEAPKDAAAPLPKPGDAPPLRVSPGAEGDPPPDLPAESGGTGPPP